MRKIHYSIMMVIVLLAGFSMVYGNDNFGAKGAKTAEDPTLHDMLIYAIQDEYLARAEYEAIIEQYGPIRPFSNIIRSEETHINLLIPLFEKYLWEVPEDRANEHIVIPPDVKSALEICVQGEIENIAMYESFLNRELPDDVREVFNRLKAASQNHLRAFRNGLKRY